MQFYTGRGKIITYVDTYLLEMHRLVFFLLIQIPVLQLRVFADISAL